MRHFAAKVGTKLGFCVKPVHNKVISGFQALHQARVLVAELKPAIEAHPYRSHGRLAIQLYQHTEKLAQPPSGHGAGGKAQKGVCISLGWFAIDCASNAP
ncbi:hypothetical protein PoB_002297300 [Plakobranchus ocellatus]|uniref:Uncharacterized protein n=1 Tax=Plakobranchus ocellatus TaxID=259542 RepID=A0AAV3ZNS6_9GAST|nr:hypothetical protein PoB_002297300 [Plakobranchus ocellatus]